MSEKKCDITVIGGGPAGMAAATTAAMQGASVVLVNDAQSLGGHYYKSLPGQFDGPGLPSRDKDLVELHSRLQKMAKSPAQVLDQARVWGIFREAGAEGEAYASQDGQECPFRIHLEHADQQAITLEADALILAPGVYDRSLPFPGWELPGVMTPGAVQMLLKTQGVLPGHRVLVGGAGPLQLLVAAELVEAGAEVVAFLDASGMLEGMHLAPGALGGLRSKIGDMLHGFKILAQKRVPIHFRHTVFRALGDRQNGVQGVVIGKVSQDGSPVPGSQRTLAVDSICCAYGFMPSIELTLHLGCQHAYDPNLCAYVPVYDERMQTSQAGVYVAGDATGVGGKAMADLQGLIAGISAAEQLGFVTPAQATQQREQLAAAVRREKRFARWLWNRYRVKSGLLALVEEDTVICRCENVLAADLHQGLADGAQDLFGAKLRTRLGMGSCQGRYCMLNAAMLVSQRTGNPVDALGLYSVRPPVTPTRLKFIAGLDQDRSSVR